MTGPARRPRHTGRAGPFPSTARPARTEEAPIPTDQTLAEATRVADLLLGGRDLACWCPLDEPCHADVLLELANRTSALR